MYITNEMVNLYNPTVAHLTKLATFGTVTVEGPMASMAYKDFYVIEELDEDFFWEISDNY